MLKLFALCAFIASCSALSCDNQAEFCKNLQTATKCKKIDTCITNVWSQFKGDKTSDICTFCETLITTVRDALSNAETEKAIENYLANACTIIPDETIAKDCTAAVDNYLPEIFQLIKSVLNPQQVCNAIGICKPQMKLTNPKVIELVQPRLRILPANKQSPIKMMLTKTNDKICDDCKKIMTDVEALISEPETEKKIETYFENNLCNFLGSLASACDDAIKQYIPMLFSMIKQELQPVEVCSALGLCTAGDHTVLPKLKLTNMKLYGYASSLNSDYECNVCKTVFNDLKAVDTNVLVQKYVETIISEEICTKLGPFESQCKQEISEYGAILFDLIATELDGDARCKSLGFCNNPAFNKVSVIRQQTEKIVKQEKMKAVKVSSEECVLCEFVINTLERFVNKNSTEEEVISALNKVCSILPDTIKVQCSDFVKTYGNAMVKLLISELKPEMVCRTLGLCSTNTKLVKMIPIKVKAGEFCPICKTVMQYVDSMLQKNSTIQEIEAVMDKVCNFLPSSLTQECDSLVQQYGPLIIHLLAAEMAPQQICTAIGLCTSSTQKTAQHLLGTDECTFGPAFWCASMENAKKCNTITHCQENGWKTK
ncbi:DgyrCDS10542 [Dimorphilus gyrociliatus]|uniref:DgyrCDS10542 n=1 Tax=Dimorphilus gyrociliatus TaxID=2664684 RepID=A0A7I8W0N4_9ANNE|nr:DgyrCDS10542 [Dimorphilus gyrociliatus]